MKKQIISLWKSLVLATAVLAIPMLAAAASPPPVPFNPLYPPGIGFNPVVDYTKPNFSQSPNLRKFVDSLPGLGSGNANNLKQYIPVATPDITSYPGDATSSAANPASDYYEIELKQYNQQLHSDLPATGTTLRGYAQVNSTDATVNGIHQYLGPLIIAKSYDPSKPAGLNGNGKPVRIKFLNRLPTLAAGNLPLPVDTTIMGAGMGPLNATEMYTQNRANLHLHGGATPWISDGTPHQWITPSGESTSYPKGVSFQNVPDMIGTAPACRGSSTCFTPTTTDGTGTYYYTNQQSGRLMFYHDHAYGITRLNVYGGMAAGYLLYDQYEKDMIEGTNVYGVNPALAKLLPDLGGVYHYGIPLIFQDKSFVNDASTPSAAATAAFPATGYVRTPKTVDANPLLSTDPLWAYYTPPYSGTAASITGGNLWFPHEYMPVENPFDPSGNTPNGRWDYGPFMIPPMIPLNVTLPSPTLIPEGFMDTAVVNGTAFPYATLPPDAFRFRILSAGNDRTFNLQLYYAKDYVTGNICKAGFPGNTAAGFTPANCTEVSMVDAAPNAAFPTWPRDGRDGGVPNPLTKGPDWIQIGNEAGLLAKVAVIPAQPIDYNYNRQVIPLAGVTSKSLLLLPAVRADVVVDFQKASAGDVLIVYNDGPAAMPNYWPLNDYYTDGPDQTATGGPVTIPPGFGPNTRTLMQIRIAGSKTSSFDFSSNGPDPTGATYGSSLKALVAALPKVFAASQDPILVPQLAYNDAYPVGHPLHFNGTTDNYVQAYQTTMSLSGTGQPIAKIMTVAPGNNYTTPPSVVIAGGGGTGAAATAGLNPIGAITILTTGSGYITAPTVTLGAPDPLVAPAVTRVQAAAVATISGGGVNAIDLLEPGANYTNLVTAPTCTIAPPPAPGVAATCSVMLPTLNTVGSIVITNPGSGYTSQPLLYLLPTTPGGLGASATALIGGAKVMTGKNMTEGFDPEYGRMDILLGSTPNPLTPNVGAGFVIGIARYIDPPTEIINDGETILWRLAHLGVDSHAMHFHLFNVQVINHVDWTGVIKPPYVDEIGWKETIRTNPMEDIILAIRPKSQVLPFTIPNSVRVLDPTTPVNSTTNFYPVAPPPGIPAVAQQSNVMTNFGWEYVWHCHLLGHEENDMMRPIVLVVVPPVAPTALAAHLKSNIVTLNWTSTAINASLYTIQRSTTTGFTAATTTTFTVGGNAALTYTDSGVTTNVTYYYRVQAYNAAGTSTWSNVVTVAVPAPPTNMTATIASATQVNLNWTDNSNNETGFAIWRSLNGAATTQIATITSTATQRTAVNRTVTYNNTGLTAGNTYAYYVTAVTAAGTSAASNSVSVIFAVPSAPTGLTATRAPATTVVLNWTDTSNNETGFSIQRATNSAFTTGLTTFTAAANATTFTNTVPSATAPYYYRVSAVNLVGNSAYATVGPVLPTAVSGVSPAVGLSSGGTAVTITGTLFAAGATVSFGGIAATNVIVVNSTSITATTPANAIGLVAVTVTNPGAAGVTLPNGFTYTDTPTVTAVAPVSGSATGGTAVTITGTNFVTGAAVSFGGIAATNATVVSSTSITAATPANAVGPVAVAVTNPGNLTATMANGYTYIPVYSVFPANAVPLVIAEPDAAAVELGMRFTSTTAGQVTGVRYYKSTTNTGTHVGSLWSNTGTLLGRVTFAGESASGWQQANFTTPVTIAANTSYVISYHTNTGYYSDDLNYFTTSRTSGPLTAPANSTASPNGVYTYGANPVFPVSGYNSSNYWVDVVFNTAATLTVSGVAPAVGLTSGGTAVTITGTNFVAGATVSFGGTAATNVVVVGSTSITATTPANAIGPVSVTVTNPGVAGAALPNGFTYTDTPTVTAVAPVSGSTAGGTAVTITGTNFVAGATVSFGVTAATNVAVVSSTSITATTPANAVGPVAVTVTNPGNLSASLTSGYTYTVTPTVTAVAPANGLTAGGTAVTITGTNFVAGATVSFGGTAATNVVVVGSTSITVTTPANAIGPVAVTVTNPGVAGVTLPNGFTYTTTPTVTAVAPVSGSTAGGTAVTITGTNFVAGATVSFGVTAATNVAVVSSTSITATTPANAVGPVAVTVTNPGNLSATLANGYSYVTIASIFAVTAVPLVAAEPDAAAVELGMKFTSTTAGRVTGVRFYKSTTNTGTHVGSLWSSTGTLLGQVTFAGESASGWQQASFTTPVAIAANTTYVISYHTNVGYYADDLNYFTTSRTSGPLTAPANSTASPNGVYTYGANPVFPVSGYNSSNYWVDVIFATP